MRFSAGALAFLLVLMAFEVSAANAVADAPEAGVAADSSTPWDPEPLAPAPDVPPEAEAQPIPPGTVSQSQASPEPLALHDRFPVRPKVDGDTAVFETAYGAFAVDKATPYIVTANRDEQERGSSFFSVSNDGQILLPGGTASVEVASTSLFLNYTIRNESGFIGRMSVVYTFEENADKIAASFSPDVTDASSASQIVWIVFTNDPLVAEPSGGNILANFDSLDQNPGQAALGSIGSVVKVDGADSSLDVESNPMSTDLLHIDFTDARTDWAGTYAGSILFGNETRHAVVITFQPYHFSIDPKVIVGSLPVDSTRYSIQRKTFFDGERYWAFWYDGTTIKYSSSVDGNAWSTIYSDVPGMPGSLVSGFTVATYGKTVAVLWLYVDWAYWVKISTGLVKGDWIRWDTNQPQWESVGSTNSPIAAAFSSVGELVFTYTSGGRAYLDRYACVATNAPPCSSLHFLTEVFSTGVMSGSPVRAFPVPFAGSQGYMAVVFASPTDPLNVFVHGDIGPGLGNSTCIITPVTGVAIGDDPANNMSGAGSGGSVSVFWRVADSGLYKLLYYTISPSCTSQPGSNGGVIESDATYKHSYLTAGTELDGQNMYLFWTKGSPGLLYYTRITPPGGATAPESPGWLSTFTGPVYTTASPVASRLIPILAMKGSELDFIGWPLPFDGIASPQNPWGQLLGAPLYGELGGKVNPAVGLVLAQDEIVQLPGRQADTSVSLLYREPGLFYGSTEALYRYYSPPIQYGTLLGTTRQVFHLDLPWIDSAGTDQSQISYPMVHVPGGQAFLISWSGPLNAWFNNTKGVRFDLNHVGSTYVLTFPSGASYEFDSMGRITKTYPDATRNNFLQYQYNPTTLVLEKIIDNLDRQVTFTYTGCCQLNQVGYGSGLTVAFDYGGGVPTGCSGTSADSGTIKITDALKRDTRYYLCKYRLTGIDFPTGGKVGFAYGTYSSGAIYQGTDVYTLPVLQEDVYSNAGAATKTRSTTFTYHAQNGEIVNAELKFYDGSGGLQGTKEFRYRSALGMSSTRVVNSAGTQMRQDRNWYSANDQPHQVETLYGTDTEPTSVSRDFVDDWGNVIYSRDALGNETFRSFANTNHQYQFYGPGSLTRTSSGKLYANGFDTSSQDWTVVQGSPLPTIDDSTFQRYMPSLKLAPFSMGTHIIKRTFAGSTAVLWEANVRSSSVQRELDIFLNSPDGTARAGAQFSSTGALNYETSTGWSACSWPSAYGGGSVTYRANTWYRLTIFADLSGGKFDVYLDGSDVCVGKSIVGAGSTIDHFRVQLINDVSAWFDDVKVARGTSITISGLQPRQSAAIVSTSNAVVDWIQTAVAGSVTLSLSSPSDPTAFQETGNFLVRVYTPDGSVEYESPSREFYGGDAYLYTAPKAFADELVRTRSGFGYWTRIEADEVAAGTEYCNPTPCTSAWTWVTRPTVSQSKAHLTSFDQPTSVREHGYQSDSTPYTPGSADFHVQYVYIPATQAPSQILLKFGDGAVWKGVSWGTAYDPGPTGTKMLGQMPALREGWIQLVVSATDAGTVGRSINAEGYEAVGGTVFWDGSALSDSTSGTVAVTGLAGLAGTHSVSLSIYWADNGTLIAQTTVPAGTDLARVSLYPKVSAFPVSAKIVITDATNGYRYYVSSPRDLWSGDIYRYLGAAGFYDQGTSGDNYAAPWNIHSTLIGQGARLGDCWDAVVCYDMESVTPDSGLVTGSGGVSPKLIDLSRNGNLATVTGAKLSAIGDASSGLGMSFDDASKVSVSTLSAPPTTALTISAWVKPSTTGTAKGIVQLGSWNNAGTSALWIDTDNKFHFGRASPDTQVASDGTASTTALSHVVGTWDGTTLRMYVNGVQQAQTASFTAVLTATSADVGVLTATPYYMNGFIDQVIVYARALSDAEVRALFDARIPATDESFLRPYTAGFILQTQLAYEGRYLVAGYSYDAYGNVLSSTDLGRNQPGPNITYYYYSDFYNGAFPTRVLRSDGREQLFSFDRDLGTVLGSLSVDCKRVRNAIDAGGRPVTTSAYDSDSLLRLYLDMETPDSSTSYPGASMLKDLSCNGNPGSFSPNKPPEVPGVEGKARSFSSASSTYVSVAHSTSLDIRGPITLAAWVNPSAVSGVQRIVSKWGDTSSERAYLLSMGDLSAGKIHFEIRTGPSSTQYINSVTALTAGYWYHVAAVYDMANLKIYVDGDLEGTSPFVGTIQGSTTPVKIGFEGDGSGTNYFNGNIDEVRVFERALSNAEILDLARMRFKLVGRTNAAFDDMVSAVPSRSFAGYQFHDVTLYDEVSKPRKLYLDMQTTISRPPINPGDINIEDLSGNGNHLLTGLATSVTGKLGQALYFDPLDPGTGLVVSDPAKLNFVEEFTIAGWFYLSDRNNRWGPYKWGSGDSVQSWALIPAGTGSKPAVWIHGTGTSFDSLGGSTSLPANAWRFVAATFDRGALKLYVDSGSALTSFSKTSTVKRIQATNQYVNIGDKMFGRIDEVQLFDLALTASEVQQLYDSYAAPTPAKVKDPSHMFKTYFDGLGRDTRSVVRDFFGNKIETKKDFLWNDRPQRMYLPSGQYHTFAYDFLGRPLTATTPGDATLSGTTTWTYTDSLRKVEVIDPIGRKDYAVSDILGRTVETGAWNPSNSTYNVTRSTHNALGQLSTSDVILPSGARLQPTSRSYYDTLGLSRSAILPSGKMIRTAYDDNLRPAMDTDEMGRVVVSTYDNLGRLAEADSKASAGSQTSYPVTYTYDGAGNVFFIQNGTTSIITRLYDARHRLVNESFIMPASSPTSTIYLAYTYDNASRVARIEYNKPGNTATYVYDSLGRVVEVDAAFGGSSAKYAEVTYDAYDRMNAVWTWDAGTNTSLVRAYAYDVRDRVTQVKAYAGSTTFLMLNYTYNKASDVTHIDDTATSNGAKAHDYAYDGQGRLAQAVGPWGSSESPQTLRHTYDAVGNIRTQETVGIGTTTYNYNYAAWNRLDSLTGATSETYAYNDDGSLLNRNAGGSITTYTYNFAQQLVRTVLPNGNSFDYSYDGIGRRLRTVETVGTPTTTYFAYSGDTLVYSKKDTTETVYVYLGGQLLFRKTTGEQARFYHSDLSNNVRLVTYYNAGVQVDYRYRYKPFGELVPLTTGSGADPKFKFAGQEFDANAGLYHMGARYQDPKLGRFTSRDPIGPGYAYAANNPLSFYDPTGTTEYPYPFYPGFGSAPPDRERVVSPLTALWERLPHWAQAVIVIAATIALMVATAGEGAWLYLTFAVLGGIALGEAFVIARVAQGETNGEVLIDSFVDGFTLGTAIVDLAFIAYRGVVAVGPRLKAFFKLGSTAVEEDAPRWVARGIYEREGKLFAFDGGLPEGFLTPMGRSFDEHALKAAGDLGIPEERTGALFDDIIRKGRNVGEGQVQGSIRMQAEIRNLRSLPRDTRINLMRTTIGGGPYKSLEIVYLEDVEKIITIYGV